MGYRSYLTMTIAIVGNSEVGNIYASALTKAGHMVYRAAASEQLISNAPINENEVYTSIEEAAADADFIILATPPNKVREAAYWLGDIRGKIVIDLSANVASGSEDNYKTLKAIRAITGSQHVVKALSVYKHHEALADIFNNEKVDIVLAGDSIKAKELFKIIAIEAGFKKVCDLGSAKTLPMLEDMANTWRSNMYQVKVSKLKLSKQRV